LATYAIGDIQGCFQPLVQLLKEIPYDPVRDKLWFAGDLVNRGPQSLETLRFIRDLGDRAITVLGNHDLHLLALWRNHHRHFKSNDTLAPIFDAPDHPELLEWLRARPLIHHDSELGYTLVHAGIPPQWDLETAQRCAREVEEVLRGELFDEFLQNMYGNHPSYWFESHTGWDRLRFTVNAFTRMRFCSPHGLLEFKLKGRPGQQPKPYLPWYEVPERRTQGQRILFGHWSTLGYHQGRDVIALDSGCLWGGHLSAYRLDDGKLFQLKCPMASKPG